MSMMLGVVKEIALSVLCNSVFINVTFFTFLWRSECARPRALKIFKVVLRILKTRSDWQLPHGIKSRIVLPKGH